MLNFQREYPHAWKDGHYFEPDIPDVTKANGLTNFITKYLTFIGAYGNRINTMGRLIDGMERQESGAVLSVKKWLPSTTKTGTGDIHAVWQGKHISIEVKIGRDKLRPEQIKEKARIERAGGLYWVVKTAEDFFKYFDAMSEQKTIFD